MNAFAKLVLLSILISGCAAGISTVTSTSGKERGYYWRDSYNHRYGNAPPVRTEDLK